MDLRLENGVVGQYNGKDVYVIQKREFDRDPQVDKGTIYMIVEENKTESLLVHGMTVIGHISPTGSVTEYHKPFRYLSSKVKAKAKVEKEPERKEEKETGYEMPVDIDGFLSWSKEQYNPIAEAKALFKEDIEKVGEGIE